MDTLTDSKTIAQIEDFINKYSGKLGYNWILATETDGVVTLHERLHQPCYGEMRVYSKSEYRPADLNSPFPDGTPVGLGVSWNCKQIKSAFYDLVISKKSPWISALKGFKVIDNKGIYFTNTKVNSDILLNLLFTLRDVTPHTQNSFDFLQQTFSLMAKETLALMSLVSPIFKHPYYTEFEQNQFSAKPYTWYYMVNADPIRILKCSPNVPSDFDFYDRSAYRRRFIEYIWANKGTRTSVKTLFPEFKNTNLSIGQVLEVIKWLRSQA